jgi:hypothetical protein
MAGNGPNPLSEDHPMHNQPSAGFPQIMAMLRGFQASQMLMTAVELGLFDMLTQPRTAAEVAQGVQADARAMGIFLNGLAALELVAKEGDRFVNCDPAARFLVKSSDNYRGAIVNHFRHTVPGWLKLTETLRLGQPRDVNPEKWVDQQTEEERAQVAAFIWGMHAIARDIAPNVAERLDLKGVRQMLDLGGGPGTYAIFFAQANPQLKATVFDLPLPIDIAQENIANYGLSARIDTLAGNFLQDGIGAGYDFIWISQILHSHTEAQCHVILDKAVQALSPGGLLGIQEFFLEDDGYQPPGPAMFSVHMLAVTPGGRAFTHQEVGQWMQAAGLSAPQHIPSGAMEASILMARKG